ncbi:MAG: hypothetical protein NUV53_01890 [Patescibacteria group bacterium]|nr:hypothetical protein [Patescibacteria group bacterium]
MKNDCPSDSILHLFARGVLPSCAAKKIPHHLETCELCRAKVVEARDEIGRVKILCTRVKKVT